MYANPLKIIEESWIPFTAGNSVVLGPDYGRIWIIDMAEFSLSSTFSPAAQMAVFMFQDGGDLTARGMSLMLCGAALNGTYLPVIGGGAFQPPQQTATKSGWVITGRQRPLTLFHPQVLQFSVFDITDTAPAVARLLVEERKTDNG